MKLLVRGTPLGEMPHYIAAQGAAHASTLRELFGCLNARAIDPVGLRQYFDRRPDGERTCFVGARLLPAGCDLYRNGEGLHWRRKLPEDAEGPVGESPTGAGESPAPPIFNTGSEPSGALLPLLEQVLCELLSRTEKV